MCSAYVCKFFFSLKKSIFLTDGKRFMERHNVHWEHFLVKTRRKVLANSCLPSPKWSSIFKRRYWISAWNFIYCCIESVQSLDVIVHLPKRMTYNAILINTEAKLSMALQSVRMGNFLKTTNDLLHSLEAKQYISGKSGVTSVHWVASTHERPSVFSWTEEINIKRCYLFYLLCVSSSFIKYIIF